MEHPRICCFTGHRKIYNDPTVVSKLRRQIRVLAESGCRTFRAGGAMGFDMMAALCVLELREELGLRLELYLPCRNQADKWSSREKSFYNHILSSADSIEYVHEAYTRSCMYDRNRRMVDGADVCVAYLKHSSGGTAYTVNYAHQKNVKVINIA